MTYTATISDGGVSVERTLEAGSIEAACEMIKQELREAEEVTAGNPDCEPRTEWTQILMGDNYAECSLRGDSQDAATWVKAVLVEAE
jgi:hypothetical protein